ncbi:hypothetical protein EPA93_21530 [Ktedonosporobacter rubrisoli]|uniref:Glycosyltransferase RgtA/B/C/D-like domain-containing protein n=1 Tax=Ktedonosporobacter rubrisoli TaxID=2509675 RepID=A0A4P6JU36_KTERU|nr:DUF2298 domain-containing protein [Ktedonosporobacter rubrisoli]QBD78436.1 hypothetical protein EPA93_21530 [Ktedonosporobacter rubrisoli]
MPRKLVVRWKPLALGGLVLFGLALRLYGLDWDQGNSFHPDERQILFHVTALSWPTNPAQFFDAAHSPLNPHFFAYGSFPLYLLAIIGNILIRFVPSLNSLAGLTLVGRALSALFDSGTILLTGWLGFLLTARNGRSKRVHAWGVALLAAALVAFTPFQIQQAHFYTVDTVLLFFVVLMLLACVVLIDTEKPLLWSLIAGASYGLALATKVSAAPLAVPLLVAVLLRWYRERDLWLALVDFLFAALVCLVVFFVAQPYALLDWQNFISQVSEQGSLARGTLDLPYVRQFAGTTPYVYEARNMLLWGLGLALGVAAFAGLLWLLWLLWKNRAGSWLVILSWILVYSLIVGGFYVKFMRYMLPVYPLVTLIAAAALVAFASHSLKIEQGKHIALKKLLPVVRMGALFLVLAGTIFQGLALLNVYSQPNTRIQASRWIYSHLAPGTVLTYEQWDDPLPVSIGSDSPMRYVQATYNDANGQPQTGLNLYGDDTEEKARQLASMLTTARAITMPTDRLDKSIPRLPSRYPLTIRYYQLLFSGQLGFHLAAQFENHPNLLGITLDDSDADESYSVFDHPTARIFVRENPYPYTTEQLLQKLMQGVQLPAPGAQLLPTQKSLLFNAQQIEQYQSLPPLNEQFPVGSISNMFPAVFWWLALLLLGWFLYPLAFWLFHVFGDRGYIFSKLLGALLLAYLAWLLASMHILPFSQLSLWLVAAVLALAGGLAFFHQRQAMLDFLRQHWRKLLLCELLFSLAYIAFVGIRALNPDLWNPYIGGEKPMEVAFLTAVLRSPYMPPLDPWFAGGYINYYYYGYVIVGALIKLTGIAPTTAFNLAIPTLFALTFSEAVVIVYVFARSLPIALLGGYFAALIGNFDGFIQLKGQLLALLVHIQPPAFNYWQSSRIIPFTINEFPFWSFLFADLHPHVMDMPIAVFMLGIIAALLFPSGGGQLVSDGRFSRRAWGLYACAAFVFGTIACVNTWDMPVYALLLAAAMAIRFLPGIWQMRSFWRAALALLLTLAGIYALGYLFYLPFYMWYQQLYVYGLGLVTQGTTQGAFMTIFGLWIFLAASFFLLELYRRWIGPRLSLRFSYSQMNSSLYAIVYTLICVAILGVVLVLGLKLFLAVLLLAGWLLFAQKVKVWLKNLSALEQTSSIGQQVTDKVIFLEQKTLYTYLLLIMGVGICLGIEIVYIRDFMSGDNERMNTVFKFSIQAWLCLALGGALALQHIWHWLSGFGRRFWSTGLAALIVCCSVFLIEGTTARISDHELWALTQRPAVSANYTPTLDGFAFVRSWYPADAGAIQWLNTHVAGSPVILEAAAPPGLSYKWFGRVSVFTGLPDVLGWADHEQEQRYVDQVNSRMTDVDIIYSTPDAAQASALLHFYHVRYVYVGPFEAQTYGAARQGLDKFKHMAGLRVAYQATGVTIYEVV